MQYLFYILLLVHNVKADDTEPWTVLPEDMELFCPSKRVCQRTPTVKNNQSGVPEMFKYCCKDCSCQESCGQTEPCCFPAMNKHVNPSRPRQSCIPASTDRYKHIAASFYMVTEETDVKKVYSNRINVSRCEDVNVATWGSLFPVFSKETGLIYKNHVCADRNGATDYVHFNAYFYCTWRTAYTDRHFFLSQYVFESTQNGSQCGVRFFPPKHLHQHIEKGMCYQDVVNTCGNETRQSSVNMTVAEVRDACESGFYSPFILRKTVYANVFCFLCNMRSGFDVGRVACQPQTNLFSPQTRTVTMLLNRNLYTGSTEAKLPDGPTLYKHMACQGSGSLKNHPSCRTVYCPTGQTYDKMGVCVWAFSELDMISPSVYLFLTPRENLTVADIPVSEPLDTWLKSPWPKTWRVYMVFSREPDSSNSTSSEQILIYLIYQKISITPERLTATMTTAIREPFQICLRPGHCVLLDQKFASYELTIRNGGLLVPRWYMLLPNPPSSEDYNLDKTPDTFRRVKRDMSAISTSSETVFGKTFLCNQVELHASDYEYIENAEILIYKPRTLVLFKFEFEVVHDRSGGYNIRICIEDSGLKPLTNHAKGWLHGDEIVKQILCSLSLTLLVMS